MAKKVVCFGEILWDNLPTGKVPGGAPMNVAIRLQSLGIETQIISKVGKDVWGDKVIAFLGSKRVGISELQYHETLPTGEVFVTLDEKGSATYDIVYPSAWDTIHFAYKTSNVITEADAFVFGSLACRDNAVKDTLDKLMFSAKFKVFDVNLRPPHYEMDFILYLMREADFVKLNEEELAEISQALGSNTQNIEENILLLASKTNTTQICVTKGKDGAVLYVEGVFYESAGFSVQVLDTVGAGDSFLAALLAQILTGKGYAEALRYACAVGAYVASQAGANPLIEAEKITEMFGIS